MKSWVIESLLGIAKDLLDSFLTEEKIKAYKKIAVEKLDAYAASTENKIDDVVVDALKKLLS